MTKKRKTKPLPKTARLSPQTIRSLSRGHRFADKRALYRKTEARRPVSRDDY